jgi:hypothetical protein
VPTEFQPKPILHALIAHDVDFVVIGGMAGMARGASNPSYDVDVAYARDRSAAPYDRPKQAAGEPIEIDEESVFVASLDHLIAMKEASGRTKDKLMATEYRVLSDEMKRE